MGTISEKLVYLNGTKQAIKQAINEDFEVIDNNTTFREYADEISSNNAKYKDLIPKETTNATNTLDILNSSGLDKTLVTQYGNTKQSILPSEYTQVDYIQSSGTQYIDTGVNADTNLRVILDMAYTNPSSANQAIGSIKIGTPNVRYHLLPTTTEINFWVNDNSYRIGGNDSDRHLIDLNVPNGQVLYDNNVITIPTNISDTGLNFWLFGRNSTTNIYLAKIKLWNCKMYYNGNLVRDFIPCYRNSDNEVGLYDLVNDIFYTNQNQGTDAFTYGSKTPTPDTPQEIVNISGKSTLKDVGKNLLPTSDIISTSGTVSNGVTFTRNSDGSITANGTATSAISIYINSDYTELSAGTYTFSDSVSSGESGTTYFLFADVKHIDGSSWDYYNFSTANTTTGMEQTIPEAFKFKTRIVVRNGQTLNNVVFKPMLENSSAATTYEPYQEQSFDLDLPFELCKIGDYQDRIYPLNGKWYLEKNIGKVVLDGSESWNSYADGSDYFYLSTSILETTANYVDGYSSHFRCLTYYPNVAGTFAFRGDGKQLSIRVNGITSVADWKTWLSTHNTEVYYVLATPTTEEITESNYPTLYNQLNNIKLFEGVNHITMTNESGLDVEFDIEYYKDWKLD